MEKVKAKAYCHQDTKGTKEIKILISRKDAKPLRKPSA